MSLSNIQRVDRLKRLFTGQKPPPALIVVAPLYLNVAHTVTQLIADRFCKEESRCQKCSNCILIREGTHPDILTICSEAENKSIKIEQIRTLQQSVYQTPKRAAQKFIVLNQAEKMNVAASNALLKVLEEPPEHTTFILITEQINVLLPTIRSRCQKVILNESVETNFDSYTAHYTEHSSRGKLCLNSERMVDELLQLLDQQITPCELAGMWRSLPVDDLMWWFNLLNSQMMRQIYNVSDLGADKITGKIRILSKSLHPIDIFYLGDKVCAIRKKISHNINMNMELALEDILIDFAGITHVRND